MILDILYLVFSVAVIGIAYLLIFKKKKPAAASSRNANANAANATAARQGAANAPENQNPNQDRRRPQEARNEENASGEESEEEKEDAEGLKEKSRKQMLKEAKKQEKKEQREAMLYKFEQKEKKEEERRKKYEERERMREEEEKKQEELQKKLEEEQRKKEEEEFNKWKDMFSVEEKGTEKTDLENEDQNMMQKFIDYIKLRKVVMLEDLSAEFKLNTADIVNRIKSLEESGILNGVFDERGKYIYITEKEMEAVFNYIKMKGRVSRSDLVFECNKLIKLNPSAQDKSKISEEENKLLADADKEFELLQKTLAQSVDAKA